MSTKAQRKKRQQKRLESQYSGSFEAPIYADVSIEAEAGEGSQRRFSIEAYDGGQLSVDGLPYPVVVELSSASFWAPNTPLNVDHDGKRPVGHSENQTITANGIQFDGPFSVPGDEQDRVIDAHKNGFRWQASIKAMGPVRLTPRGKQLQANGRSFQGPVFLMRSAKVSHCALVSEGASEGSSVAIAASATQFLGEDEMSIAEFCAENGIDEAALSDAGRAKIEAALTAETVVVEEPPAGTVQANAADPIASLRTEMADEFRRMQTIRASLADHPELADKAIEQEWDTDRIKLEAKLADQSNQLEEMKAATVPTVVSVAPGVEPQDMGVVFEAALSKTYGMSDADAEKFYNERTLEAANSKQFRGMSMHGLFRAVIQAAGMSYYGGTKDGLVEKAGEANVAIQASSAFSTMNITKIFTDAVNKSSLSGYRRAESIIPYFCGRKSATDFKPLYSFRLEGSGEFEPLAKDGSIKHGTLVENEYTVQLSTYAKMLSLTRKHMINDDLGVLTDIGSKLGTMAYKVHERTGVELLLNPSAGFFSTTGANANLITGATSALSIDAVSEADQLAENMVDDDGYPIMVDFDRILTASANKIRARNIATEETIVPLGATDRTEFQRNPHSGSYVAKSSKWLGNGQVDGADPDAWFMFANPSAGEAAFFVSYLNGRDQPVIESSETAFNTLGMQWRGYYEFGFGQGDRRLAIRSDGK